MLKQSLLSAAAAAALLLTGTGLAHATIAGPETPDLTAISAPTGGGHSADISVGLSSNLTSASDLSFNGSTVSLSAGDTGSLFYDLQVRDKGGSDNIFSLVSTLASPLTVDVSTQNGTFAIDITIAPNPDVTSFTTPNTDGSGGFDVFFNYLTDPPSIVSFDVLDPNGTPLVFGLPSASVPEPASLALLGVGLAGLGLLRRRRQAV